MKKAKQIKMKKAKQTTNFSNKAFPARPCMLEVIHFGTLEHMCVACSNHPLSLPTRGYWGGAVTMNRSRK